MTTLRKLDRTTVVALAALAALGTLAGTPARAQDDRYFFGGVGVGQARARIDDRRITEVLAGSGFTTDAIAHDERHTAYKVFGGYQFNRYVGMELGFFHLGRFGFNASTTPEGTLAGSFRVQGANLDVVGTLPFTENFSGLARIGAQYARTRDEISSTGAVFVSNPRPSDRETNAKVGLGLQYAFSRAFHMRAEVERFRVSDGVGNHPRLTVYTVGAVFPFGRPAAVRRASAMPMSSTVMASTPMATMPAPAPAPAPLLITPAPESSALATGASPAPPAPRRVSYAAESFFAFDRADLQDPGRLALDTFVDQVRGARFDTITVQGYADRLGTTAYNQTLSLARADSVKAYLVTVGRLDADRIKTVGRSETTPVTQPEACKGPISAAVIACLQPDRRVELEVSGWR